MCTPPPEGYLESVFALCQDTGILLVVDSVVCAFGRLGTWWGTERWDLTPDMICFAKGVTSGYLPLGGVLVAGRVAEPFWSEPGGPTFPHGVTYAGHANLLRGRNGQPRSARQRFGLVWIASPSDRYGPPLATRELISRNLR